VKRSGRITAPQLWLVMAKSYRVLRLRAEESIVSAGLCLTDFAALEALLHKGPLTITEIQQKVLLASGSMTAAIDRLEKLGLVARLRAHRGAHGRRQASGQVVLRKARQGSRSSCVGAIREGEGATLRVLEETRAERRGEIGQ